MHSFVDRRNIAPGSSISLPPVERAPCTQSCSLFRDTLSLKSRAFFQKRLRNLQAPVCLDYALDRTHVTRLCAATLPHTARTHSYTLQHTASHCITLHHTATHCNALHHTATHCITLHHTASHCITLHHTATHCITLQHTATHRNTLQHTATDCNTVPMVSNVLDSHMGWKQRESL